MVSGFLGENCQSRLLGKLEVIVEGLITVFPRDAVAGLDFLVGELDGEGNDKQVFSGIGDGWNCDVPDVEFSLRCKDAGHLVKDL